MCRILSGIGKLIFEIIISVKFLKFEKLTNDDFLKNSNLSNLAARKTQKPAHSVYQNKFIYIKSQKNAFIKLVQHVTHSLT